MGAWAWACRRRSCGVSSLTSINPAQITGLRTHLAARRPPVSACANASTARPSLRDGAALRPHAASQRSELTHLWPPQGRAHPAHRPGQQPSIRDARLFRTGRLCWRVAATRPRASASAARRRTQAAAHRVRVDGVCGWRAECRADTSQRPLGDVAKALRLSGLPIDDVALLSAVSFSEKTSTQLTPQYWASEVRQT